MRFLPHEHLAITSALRAHGTDPASVLFVKRRGRLHVEIPGRPDAFVFFRKKSTVLDEQGRWQHRLDYFLGHAKAEGIGSGWEEVLHAFNGWLQHAER